MSNKLPYDPSTQSNWQEVASEHIDLDWSIDFEQKAISGSATHVVRLKIDNAEEVIFDTFGLEITEVVVNDQPRQFVLGPKHEVMGRSLHITLPSDLKTGDTVKVQVFYYTTEDSIALQWLEKEQTQGKLFPFMFSQCQPIYARSLAPLQDTSSAKITYNAQVSSVLPALLSAIRVSPPLDGPPHDGKEMGKDVVTYKYTQPIAIPTYLIAVAVGRLSYRENPKAPGKEWTTGIWAEPETIEDAYKEFSEDMPKFLAKAEEMLPPYRFQVYDVLVLPPSFPYGGMENPCLTFVTPALIVGDRSLVDVVVHELSHSWFGNSITQANSTHFWLNEGWTTYMERVLLQKIHTAADRGLAYFIGYKALIDSLKEFEDKGQPQYQRLVIDFKTGEDPDGAYSDVPYEKGSNFLLHLETVLGGLDVFLPYVLDYVTTFMGQSITTDMWKNHLFKYWEAKGSAAQIKALNDVEWEQWLYGEGCALPVEMQSQYDQSLVSPALDLAKRWNNSRTEPDVTKLDFKPSDVASFSANEKMVFLEQLQLYPALPETHITHLGELYNLLDTPNVELRWRFYMAALLDPSSSAAHKYALPAAKWVTGTDGSGVIIGRMKYNRPTFRAINKVDRELAVRTYEENKIYFHPIARKFIEQFLGSKLSVSSVRGSIKELIAESTGEKKRNFVETVELQIGLKNYDPQRDKRFSGTVKCVLCYDIALYPKTHVST
ncbi:metalloprotease [Daedaleopsis nitida]|nr:metalloprotease [Daedaleopsis nitida]